MQITGGKFKRKRLKSVPTAEVRPTARRLRELLFEYLSNRMAGARFLDLCAGSGAIGIEALSRGAVHSIFVDRSESACALIKSNLTNFGVSSDQATIVSTDAVDYLATLTDEESQKPDIAYFDPPYAEDYTSVIEACGSRATLRRGAILVVEHHADVKLVESYGVLRRWRMIRQGDSCLSFYERKR